jgi:hypothetical protein
MPLLLRGTVTRSITLIILVACWLPVQRAQAQAQDLVLQNKIISSTESFSAVNSITAGPNVTITSTGDAAFRSKSVVLRPGFLIALGGELNIYTTNVFVALSPSSLSFGDVQVGSFKDLIVTVTNNGSAALSGSITGASSNDYAILAGGGSYSINSGESKAIAVRLTPISEGSKTDTLSISHNASNESSPISVALTGNGVVISTDTEEELQLPTEFALHANFPNPFNPATTLVFDLTEPAEVSVEITDVAGRVRLVIPAQRIAAGSHRMISVNAENMASGTYLYRLIARGTTAVEVGTGRMVLLK